MTKCCQYVARPTLITLIHSWRFRDNTHTEWRVLNTDNCSDIDVLSFYLSGLKPSKVQSLGSVGHFKPSKKPKEAGDAKRCQDCAYAKDCVWEAKKIYVDPLSQVEDSQRVSPVSCLDAPKPVPTPFPWPAHLFHLWPMRIPFHHSENVKTRVTWVFSTDLAGSGPNISSMPTCSILKMSRKHSRPHLMVDACTNVETTLSTIKLLISNMRVERLPT